MNSIIFPDGYTFRFSNVKCTGTVMHSHHYHDDKFEIYYMVSGECNYFIDDKTYEVIPGDIVLIPEGVIHRTDYGASEHSRLLIECSSNYIPDSVKERLASVVYLYRNPTVSRDIYHLLKKIEEEYKNPDEFSFDVIRSHVAVLLYMLVRNEGTVEIADSKNEMIDSVVLYIKQNYHADINLSTAAKLHFVSPEHLSRSFRRYTGFGFNEFLTLVRLRAAEHLLKEQSNMSISDIAYSCGFNDSNYFSNKFKKAYGISPLKYSKDCK